ncbi:hypothetical protein Acr_27g0006930 [Actinidia rufa]|uniref:Uncharacterized protein n=1 Tax=Actinidia rufa TaxID=165716 RepID=A0A7J0H853_9ERIC|nr:hypothetical protein Acr_27g0006930 [Actinidia rufa]
MSEIRKVVDVVLLNFVPGSGSRKNAWSEFFSQRAKESVGHYRSLVTWRGRNGWKGWLDRMLHMGQFAVKGKHDFLGIDKRKLTGMPEQGMKEACGICLPRSESSSSRGVWRCQSGSVVGTVLQDFDGLAHQGESSVSIKENVGSTKEHDGETKSMENGSIIKGKKPSSEKSSTPQRKKGNLKKQMKKMNEQGFESESILKNLNAFWLKESDRVLQIGKCGN